MYETFHRWTETVSPTRTCMYEPRYGLSDAQVSVSKHDVSNMGTAEGHALHPVGQFSNLMRMVNYAGDVEIFVNKNIIDAKVRMIDREPVLAFVQKGI